MENNIQEIEQDTKEDIILILYVHTEQKHLHI